MKYIHGLVVFCFVVVIWPAISDSWYELSNILQGCFTGTGAIIWLSQCQWSNTEGYGSTQSEPHRDKMFIIYITLSMHCAEQETPTCSYLTCRIVTFSQSFLAPGFTTSMLHSTKPHYTQQNCHHYFMFNLYQCINSFQEWVPVSKWNLQVPNLQINCCNLTTMRGYQDSNPSNGCRVL